MAASGETAVEQAGQQQQPEPLADAGTGVR